MPMRTEHITTSLTAAQQIGRLVREQRRWHHMTGEQLAQKVGVSQSKIAKIENGYSTSIDPPQIEKILNILGSPKIIRQQIAILLFQVSNNPHMQLAYPFTEFPGELNDLQRVTTTFRCYTAGGISAVLQTLEYRTAFLKRLGFSDEEAQQELGQTIQRQDALWDATKTFYIVMPETALYTLPGDVQTQAAQLDRLERIIGAKNIYFGVIPTQAGLSVFVTGSFTFYDDRLLYTFTGDRLIRLRDVDVIAKYLNAFTELSERACFNAEAIELIRKAGNYFAGISVGLA